MDLRKVTVRQVTCLEPPGIYDITATKETITFTGTAVNAHHFSVPSKTVQTLIDLPFMDMHNLGAIVSQPYMCDTAFHSLISLKCDKGAKGKIDYGGTQAQFQHMFACDWSDVEGDMYKVLIKLFTISQPYGKAFVLQKPLIFKKDEAEPNFIGSIYVLNNSGKRRACVKRDYHGSAPKSATAEARLYLLPDGFSMICDDRLLYLNYDKMKTVYSNGPDADNSGTVSYVVVSTRTDSDTIVLQMPENEGQSFRNTVLSNIQSLARPKTTAQETEETQDVEAAPPVLHVEAPTMTKEKKIKKKVKVPVVDKPANVGDNSVAAAEEFDHPILEQDEQDDAIEHVVQSEKSSDSDGSTKSDGSGDLTDSDDSKRSGDSDDSTDDEGSDVSAEREVPVEGSMDNGTADKVKAKGVKGEKAQARREDDFGTENTEPVKEKKGHKVDTKRGPILKEPNETIGVAIKKDKKEKEKDKKEKEKDKKEKEAITKSKKDKEDKSVKFPNLAQMTLNTNNDEEQQPVVRKKGRQNEKSVKSEEKKPKVLKKVKNGRVKKKNTKKEEAVQGGDGDDDYTMTYMEEEINEFLDDAYEEIATLEGCTKEQLLAKVKFCIAVLNDIKYMRKMGRKRKRQTTNPYAKNRFLMRKLNKQHLLPVFEAWDPQPQIGDDWADLDEDRKEELYAACAEHIYTMFSPKSATVKLSCKSFFTNKVKDPEVKKKRNEQAKASTKKRKELEIAGAGAVA